jgi:hypothetical protein
MDLPAPFANNHKDPSFEIYSPPYLFRGARPQITYAPSGIAYGSHFTVDLGAADAIDSVTLIRVPAQTHTMQSDSRAVQLAFTQAGSALTVTSPPDGVTAPPGPYYLFVNKKSAKGPIPSVAAITTVGTANAVNASQPMGASVKGTKATRPSVRPGKRLVATETLPKTHIEIPPPPAISKDAGVTAGAREPSRAGTLDAVSKGARNVAWKLAAGLVLLVLCFAFGRRVFSRRAGGQA